MFKKILLPFDGLKNTYVSAKYAIYLAKLLDAKLHVLYIIRTSAVASAKACLGKHERHIKKYCIERIKCLFEEIKEEARKAGLKNYELNIAFGENVTKGVIDAIKKKEIDLCIVQPSPYYHSELTGDLAKRVSSKVKMPTLFVETKGILAKGATILAPIDEIKENMISVKAGIALAKQIKGKVIFYHTTWREKGLKTEEAIKHCDPRVVECIGIAEKIAMENKVEYEIIVEMEKTIEAGIIKCAVRNQADLIVMTSSPAIIGGQAELVLDNSMYPLLLVKK
jgi:nucleotide-binding universal stress UspA family protein